MPKSKAPKEPTHLKKARSSGKGARDGRLGTTLKRAEIPDPRYFRLGSCRESRRKSL
ncbi:MAG: hypothetical protein LBF22_04875 [Deltaproteobacteria bacterium]|jgi:hypothetical protein|nr:hypothetical protein [Deltaproteobacteria bacterium]